MNERQFETMVHDYERLIYTVCFQMVHDPQTAEDLVQDTFLSAWTHAAQCPAGAEKPWLCRIAVNKARDYLKSAYNRRVYASDAPELSAPAETPGAGVETLCEAREEARRAAACISGLEEPYRTVCVLYFGHGVRVEQIAAALGRTPKTVHTQLYRARKKLRQSLSLPCPA